MFKKSLLIMLLLEGLSLLAFVYPVLNLPLLVFLGLLTLWFAWRRPEWGIYILFGELFIGSRGHLLDYHFGPVKISLRFVIFIAIFLVWLIGSLRAPRDFFPQHYWRELPKTFSLLWLVILWGIARGVLAHNGLANVYSDVSAYWYWAILPVALASISSRAAIADLLEILGAAVTVVAIQTLGLFVWFAYGFAGAATLYHWIIAQNFGEITGVVGMASRIFLASQFYALVGIFIFALTKKRVRWIILAAAVLSVVLSLSRSFWLGGAGAGAFVLLIYLLYNRKGLKELIKIAFLVAFLAVLEIGVLYLATSFGPGRLSQAVTSRIGNPAQEAAGGARLLLLPELLRQVRSHAIFGAGFGRVVAYSSYLPDRVTAQNPSGNIANYRFEWGYLDILLKFGAIGFLVYLFFVAEIFARGWRLLKNPQEFFSAAGWLAGLVALLILHITTPYLNHPLGIGFLILAFLNFTRHA